MANQLDEIVQVSIDAQTAVPTTAQFSIPLILAEFSDFTDSRTRTYNSLSAGLEDFDASSDVGKMLTRVFGQDNAPTQVIVGRKLGNETYTTAINAVAAENDTWFVLLADTHVVSEVLELAAYIATTKKIYFTSSQDAANITANNNGIGAQLKALGYDQTTAPYHSQADTYFPEAGWVGSQISYTPGKNSWEFKTIEGVPVDTLSATARGILEANNMPYYVAVAGVNITRNSKMADGTFIDQKIGEFWTIARMQESVFGMLVRKPKVPYTDAGFTMVEAQMRNVLALGVANELYSSYTITVPRVSDIPENQRLQRIAGDFLFDATLAGAIHKVIIKGVVHV